MFDLCHATRLKTVHLGYYVFGITAVWTLFIAFSTGWNYRKEISEATEAAKLEARTVYEKDVLYRRWNANRGGLYAEITPSTPPNPLSRCS
jgi:hypothetical protein